MQNEETIGVQANKEQASPNKIKVLTTMLHEKGLWKTIIQFIKFGMVGGLNTVIGYTIVNGGFYLLHIDKYISGIISNIITIFISFLLNSRFVFHQTSDDKSAIFKTVVKVYASYLFTGMIIGAFLLTWIQCDLLGIPLSIATIINLVVTIPLNFVLNKFWVYKKN